MSPISKNEIEIPRHIDDLRNWYEARVVDLTREELLLRRGPFVKELLEEIHPALIYLENILGENTEVLYQPVMGSQPFDGRIYDGNGKLKTYVECTYAMDGQLEDLRKKNALVADPIDLHFIPKGYVRGKKGGTPEFKMTMENTAEKVRRFSSYVSECLDKKIKKRYPEESVLLIAHAGFPGWHPAFASILTKAMDKANEIQLRHEAWLVCTSDTSVHRIR